MVLKQCLQLSSRCGCSISRWMQNKSQVLAFQIRWAHELEQSSGSPQSPRAGRCLERRRQEFIFAEEKPSQRKRQQRRLR